MPKKIFCEKRQKRIVIFRKVCYTIIEFAYSAALFPQSDKGFTQKGAQSC